MSKLLILGILQQQCNAQQGGGTCFSADWNNISGNTPQSTNYQDITIDSSIYISWSGTGSPVFWFRYYLDGTLVNESTGLPNDTVYLLDGETIYGTEFTNSYNQIAFKCINNGAPGSTVSGTMTIKCGSSSGDTIDTFTYSVTKPGCFLTTACVEYMILADNGDELNAMRRLRDEYMNIYFPEEITAYYENAPKILQAIPNKNWNNEMEEIFRVVRQVQGYLKTDDFENARKIYLELYYSLLKKYI